MALPTRLRAGTSLRFNFRDSATDYVGAGWTGAMHLRRAGQSTITQTAGTAGSDYQIDLDATGTDWPAGTYELILTVALGDEMLVLSESQLLVEPGVTSPKEQTAAEIELAAVRAAIAECLTGRNFGAKSYETGNDVETRRVEYDLAELRKQESILEARVAAERGASRARMIGTSWGTR